MYPLEKKATVFELLPKAYLHPMVFVVDVIRFPESAWKFAPGKNDADLDAKSASFLKRCYGESRHISEILPAVLREVIRQ